jgi:hypothetical protein
VNTVLGSCKCLWGVFFSVTGFGKVLCYNPALWNQALQEVPWLSAVPQDLFIFIGVCEFLGGVGLLLPAMTGVKPKLTPFGAFGPTLVVLLAAVFHIVRASTTLCPSIWCCVCEAHKRPRRFSIFRVLRGSRRAGPRRFCSGLVQVDTHSLTLVSHRSAAGIA